MEKLIFDTGLKEFEVNGKHFLRFNPSDPNVYARFMEVYGDILSEEDSYVKEMQELRVDDIDELGFAKSKEALLMMKKYDSHIKERLSYVFGAQNDFNEILDGINILAVTGTGERVITNLLNALTPIIEDGMKAHTDAKAQEAVEKARLNREQRRTLAREA